MRYTHPTLAECVRHGVFLSVRQSVDFESLDPICHFRARWHDMNLVANTTESFLELKRLHTCIHKGDFFGVGKYGENTYLTAIPYPIYDWYKRHTFDEVALAWATAVARVIVRKPDCETSILDYDVPSVLIDEVQSLVTKIRRGDKPRNRLPKWMDLYNPPNAWFLGGPSGYFMCATWGFERGDVVHRTVVSWYRQHRALHVSDDPRTLKSAALASYKQFCVSAGCRTLSPRQFFNELELYGFKVTDAEVVGVELHDRHVHPRYDNTPDTLARSESDADAFLFCKNNQNGTCWQEHGVRVKKPAGYIYILTDGEFYKIGYTRDKEIRRRGQCQTGNARKITVVGYVRGSREKEAIWHSYFASKHVSGEWFALDSKDIKLVLGTTARPERSK